MFRPAGASGFSLLELVLVITIVGVLAMVAAPRFSGSSAFEERGFHDQLVNALRYAQKVAIASGCSVEANVGADGLHLRQPQHADCSGPHTRAVPPPDQSAAQLTALGPAGVRFNSRPARFVFDPLGSTATDVTLAVGRRLIRIDAPTGFIETDR